MKNNIYCCMQFYNEFKLLKLKLEELWNVVDYFVLIEGNATHTGIAKPYNFLANQDKFKNYLDKIIYEPISNDRYNHNNEPLFKLSNERHDAVVEEINRIAPWDTCLPYYSRDIYEKESLIVPLLDRCNPKDIIILGDCDEIPNSITLKELKDNFSYDTIYHLYHKNFWYYMNLEKTDERWYGNIVLSYKKYLENSFCNMRQHKSGVFIPNAGWHFSYMPVDRIKGKMEAITHQDLMTEQVKNNVENNIKNAITINKDLYNRPAKFEKVDITYESHPKYLVDHLEEFEEYILE